MTPLHPDVNPCMLPTHPYTRLSRPLLPRRTSDDPTHVIPSAQLSLSHNASLEETSNSTDNILRERGVFVVTLRDTPCSARNEIKKGEIKGSTYPARRHSWATRRGRQATTEIKKHSVFTVRWSFWEDLNRNGREVHPFQGRSLARALPEGSHESSGVHHESSGIHKGRKNSRPGPIRSARSAGRGPHRPKVHRPIPPNEVPTPPRAPYPLSPQWKSKHAIARCGFVHSPLTTNVEIESHSCYYSARGFSPRLSPPCKRASFARCLQIKASCSFTSYQEHDTDTDGLVDCEGGVFLLGGRWGAGGVAAGRAASARLNE